MATAVGEIGAPADLLLKDLCGLAPARGVSTAVRVAEVEGGHAVGTGDADAFDMQ